MSLFSFMSDLITPTPAQLKPTKLINSISTTDFHIITEENNFNLEYPVLEQRKHNFYKILVEITEEFEKNNFDICNTYNECSAQYNSIYEFCLLILQGTNNDYRNRYSQLIAKLTKNDNYIELLYFLNLSFEEICKSLQDSYRDGYSLERSYHEKFCDYLLRVFKILNKYNLDYFFNNETESGHKNPKIVRKLDLINTNIINRNLNLISDRNSYQNCIDDFLSPNPKKNKLEILSNIKDILQDVLSEKGVLNNNLPIRLANKSEILELICKGGSSKDLVLENIVFIIENIHHNQIDLNTRSVSKFKPNSNEFIYWWLEINNFIYILTK